MRVAADEKTNAAIYAAIDPPILPEGTQVNQGKGWYQVINPLFRDASANEIMLSQLTDSEIDQRVETAISDYGKHNLPFKWAIGPMSSPPRLETIIAPLASASWGFRGMAIDTDAEITTNPNVTVELVDPQNFDDFLKVNLDGWDLHPFRDQTRIKLSRIVNHPSYRSYLVKKNDIPIGSAGTRLKGHYGYLVGAVIVKDFRGCGAYKALTQARLRDLKSMNINFAVSQARDATSAPILEKLGFETLYHAKIYRFDSSQPT